MLLESLRYEDLVDDADLTAVVERAFGREGLGIVAVTRVPDIGDFRREMMELGRRFANLSEDIRARYEHPSSSFSFGWSHGKETLEAGRPDLAKGSFYANPCFDAPFAEDPAAVSSQPAFAHPNVWPDDEVPGFSAAFKALGQAVVRVGTLVARQCDRYVARVHRGYEEGKLERIVSTSRCCKGRFLHYFPRSFPRNGQRSCANHDLDRATSETSRSCLAAAEGQEGNPDLACKGSGQDDGCPAATGDGAGMGSASEIGVFSVTDDDGSFSDWCGWHHDHSSLTGLVPAMLFDAQGKEVANADPNCGLFIRSRKGVLVKIALPRGESPSSCLLFQIGETTQVHSGGALQATPHAVRSTSRPGISREAFAVFMQPGWAESMDTPIGTGLESTRSLHAASLLPRAAAPITERLRPGMDFGAFSAATVDAFYR
ncbi:unnamed protein product [Ascophyllum nodosum]